MKFWTESGSCYELDAKGKRVRRLECPSGRASRHLSEEWAPFIYCSLPVTIGFSMSFAWDDESVTTTSKVTGFLRSLNSGCVVLGTCGGRRDKEEA